MSDHPDRTVARVSALLSVFFGGYGAFLVAAEETAAGVVSAALAALFAWRWYHE